MSWGVWYPPRASPRWGGRRRKEAQSPRMQTRARQSSRTFRCACASRPRTRRSPDASPQNHTLYALADFVLLRVELVVILTVSVVNDIDWSLRWCRYALSHSCRRDATRENAALGKRARRGDAGGFRAAFSQVLSLQTRRQAPERKGQPRFQFVCFEAASVNLKVSEGER